MGDRRDVFAECHPAVSFLYFGAVMITTMFTAHPVILIFSFIGALFYNVLLYGIRKCLRNQVLFYFPLLLLVTGINMAFQHYGVTALFYLRTGPVTVEALVYGLVLAGTLWTALVWFSNINRVMTTDKFVYLFGRIAPAFALLLSMIFRFVPRYISRLKIIRSGQKCLGRDRNSANLIYRIKSGIEELSILITWALESGVDTADSMQARGYGVAKRTSYAIFSFEQRDKIISAAAIVFFGICLAGFFGGSSFAQYNPLIVIGGFPLKAEGVLVYVCWLLFVLLPVEIQMVGRGAREVKLWISSR